MNAQATTKEYVEGVWNGFTIKIAQREHYSDILAHLRSSFYRDEPFNMALGNSPAKDEDFDAMAIHYMEKYQLSFFALDNETQRVAGVTIISIKKKSEDVSDLVAKLKSPEFQEKLFPFLVNMQNDVKIFDIYSNIDHYAHLSIISVDKEFRGRGLASEMSDRAIARLKADGFPLLDATFTSPHTRKIGVAKGFKELASKFFRDFKNENGDIVFSGATEEDLASMMVLEL